MDFINIHISLWALTPHVPLHRWRKNTSLFFHRARSMSLKGKLKKKYLFSVSGPRQIKVVAGHVAMVMTPKHSASSSSPFVKCEFELPEGFSSPRGLWFTPVDSLGTLTCHCLLLFYYSSPVFMFQCWTLFYVLSTPNYLRWVPQTLARNN